MLVFRRGLNHKRWGMRVTVLLARGLCRETRFWRHYPSSSELRCGLRRHRLGAIELTFSRVGARFCRHVCTLGDIKVAVGWAAVECRGPGRSPSVVDLEGSTNRSGVWFQGFWSPATGAGAPFCEMAGWIKFAADGAGGFSTGLRVTWPRGCKETSVIVGTNV